MTDIRHICDLHRALEFAIRLHAADDSPEHYRAYYAEAAAHATQPLADNAPIKLELGNIVIEISQSEKPQ